MAFECIHSDRTQSRLRLIIYIASLTSVVLSIFSIERCTFVLSGAISDPNAQDYAWGLFSTPVYDAEGHIQGCIAYPSSTELGTSMKTAQAFGIVNVVFIITIFLGLTMVQFFLDRGVMGIYHAVRVLLPSSFLCQLLTFTVFASKFCSELVDELDENKGTVPATCTPGGAGVVAIFNLVAIIIMTSLMSLVTPPEHPVFQLYGTGNSVRVIQKNSTKAKGNALSSRRGGVSKAKPKPRQYHHNHNKHARNNRSRKVEQYTMREPQRPGREKIRTTVVNGPDVRKTIKEITYPDGSQTITTTVEELRSYTDEEDIDSISDVDDDSLTMEEEEVDDDDSTMIEVL